MKSIGNFLFLLSLLLCVSCSNDPSAKLKNALKDVVIEKGSGLVTDYEFLDMEIDTVRVKDIKAFIDKSFPKKDFPNGVPSDFEDEEFEQFTAPLKEKSNDDDICYLSVKHKYSFFNPFLDKKTENIAHRLFVEKDGEYKYVADDLRNESSWMGVINYRLKKAEEELDSVMNEIRF